MPPSVGKGAISIAFVRPFVCLSVSYIVNNSRTQMPSVPKFGRKVPRLRCDSRTSFKVKRSNVRVRGGRWHTVSAEPGTYTACLLLLSTRRKSQVLFYVVATSFRLSVCLSVCLSPATLTTAAGRGLLHRPFMLVNFHLHWMLVVIVMTVIRRCFNVVHSAFEAYYKGEFRQNQRIRFCSIISVPVVNT